MLIITGARAEAMRNERGRRVSMRDGRSGRDRDDYSNGGRYTRRSSSMGGPVRGASTGRMSSGMRGDEPRRRNFNDEKRNERFGSRMDNRMEEFDSYGLSLRDLCRTQYYSIGSY